MKIGAVLIVTAVSLAVMVSPATAQAPRFCQVRQARQALERAAPTPPKGVQLLIDEPEIASGQVAYARLANFGNAKWRYGREFVIERLDGGVWVPDPATPSGPWVRIAGILRPGFAGRCYRFEMSLNQQAGSYRFSTRVSSYGNRSRTRLRTAEFSVP